MDKGVIVYICDSRGVRDIYEADGASTIAASEPLVVLVWTIYAYKNAVRSISLIFPSDAIANHFFIHNVIKLSPDQ
jgi:hypothetical protein